MDYNPHVFMLVTEVCGHMATRGYILRLLPCSAP